MVIKHLTVASEELISKPASLINMLKTEIRQLTHLSQMEFPTIINCISPILFYRLLGGIFHFYLNFNP